MAEMSYEDLMARFIDLQEKMLAIQQQQADGIRLQEERTRPKENPNYVPASPFVSPDGSEWREHLMHEVYFGPIRLNRTPLTEDEVDALNRLQPVEKASVVKLDGSRVTVTVRPKEDALGRIERLTIELPMKKDDNPQHYPSLRVLAMQLVAAAKEMAAA